MGLLNADVPQLFTAANSFTDQAALFRGTLGQAEGSAAQAQAFHVGESGTAFQVAHAKFIEASQRINTLLDIAQANVHEAGSTYLGQDQAAAADMATSAGTINSNPM